LGRAITSFDKFNFGDRQIIYILREQIDPESPRLARVLGFIKVGFKPLFVMDQNGNQFESRPLCVLDFYIVEEIQRRGCGRRLFEFILSDLNLRPAQLAIDRPSQKFKGFLRKHYGLVRTIPQVNNFVIFDDFFRFNQPKRQRNRLTDDFSERRRYQKYVRGSNSYYDKPTGQYSESTGPKPQRMSESALPILQKPRARIEHVPVEGPVNHKPQFQEDPLFSEPLSINRDVIKRKPPSPVNHRSTPTHTGYADNPLSYKNSQKDKDYAAFLEQYRPQRNREKPQQNYSTPAGGGVRHYSRHNSAFNLFGVVNKHY
jgi:alpha-tubulin N-acetyltransferase 1